MECELVLPATIDEAELADRIAWETWWSLARDWQENRMEAGTFEGIRHAAYGHLEAVRTGVEEHGASRRVRFGCSEPGGVEALAENVAGAIARRLPSLLDDAETLRRLGAVVGTAVRDVLDPFAVVTEVNPNPVAPKPPRDDEAGAEA